MGLFFGGQGFLAGLGRKYVGACCTRGARSRRWCGWWGTQGSTSIIAGVLWLTHARIMPFEPPCIGVSGYRLISGYHHIGARVLLLLLILLLLQYCCPIGLWVRQLKLRSITDLEGSWNALDEIAYRSHIFPPKTAYSFPESKTDNL